MSPEGLDALRYRVHHPLDGLVLVVGGRGSGKTTLLQYLERTHRKDGAKFVVWDRMGHWPQRPGRIVVRCAEAEGAAQVAVKHAPCTLILDEAQLAFPTWGPKHGSALREISHIGRQAVALGPWKRSGPVAILAATQRPSTVWTGLRGLLDRAFIGRFPPGTSAGDLKWLEALDVDVSTLADLQRGQFIDVRLS